METKKLAKVRGPIIQVPDFHGYGESHKEQKSGKKKPQKQTKVRYRISATNYVSLDKQGGN